MAFELRYNIPYEGIEIKHFDTLEEMVANYARYASTIYLDYDVEFFEVRELTKDDLGLG